MSGNFNRRDFICRTSVSASVAIGAGLVGRAAGFTNANDRPRIAAVGTGSRWDHRATGLASDYGAGKEFPKYGDLMVVCDADSARRDRAAALVKDWTGRTAEAVTDYRSIIDRDDIDIVHISTPDHWHAKIAIEAMLSGKDVYCEKPMTLTIAEGQLMSDVCRRTGQIVQIGTQQRSTQMFVKAIAMIRAGRIGQLQHVTCSIGGAPTSPELPAVAPPKSLNWNLWQGPTPAVGFRRLDGAYGETKGWSRGHYEFRWWYEYSGGKLTDWGAHHVDIATWAMGKTATGPVHVDPVMAKHPVPLQHGYPTQDNQFNTATEFLINADYADGMQLTIRHDLDNGLLFEGTQGRIFANRGRLSGQAVEDLATHPLPEGSIEQVYKDQPLTDHFRNFFDAVAARKEPVSDVFSHHRALSTCHLAGIAIRLGRSIRWDPQDEQIVGDDQRNNLSAVISAKALKSKSSHVSNHYANDRTSTLAARRGDIVCDDRPRRLRSADDAGPDQQPAAHSSQIFARENLVAWCIVPFDGKQRGPAERAAMCVDLELKKIAYDWRDEHIATFEEEILAYKQRGLEYFAFWGSHDQAFRLFEKHGLHPQIWSMFDSPADLEQDQRVQAAAEQLLPLVEQTRKLGSKLGLYNHGGWSGQPENMLAVCRYLREKHGAEHVGIVYNLHHAHDRIDDFAAVMRMLQPYLLCLNLNGMTRDAEKQDRKILPLGQGEFDVALLTTIRDSGYRGPIGIIGHTLDDVEQRLQDNLDGLDWILPQLDGKPAGPRPKLRTWPPKREGPAVGKVSATVREAKSAVAARPLPPKNRGAETHAYSAQRVAELADDAQLQGNAARGLVAFCDAKSACLSCHKLGRHGGTVGPDLSQIGKQRSPTEIVEAILWPGRQVKPEYLTHVIVTDDGLSHRGTLIRESAAALVLRDPTQGPQHEISIPVEEIEFRQEVGTLMPDNLTAAMTGTQLRDLLHLLIHLGREQGLPLTQIDSIVKHAVAHSHGPATFPIDRQPLQPEQWPSWQHHVNRDRIYDFYAKQADHFRTRASAGEPLPTLLSAFPGLDGGTLGHWGNQNETTWASDLWNATDRGTLQSGVFHGAGKTVARGVCVRLGDHGEMACCFNPDTLAYEAAWTGGFLKTSSFRHGFLDGLRSDGNPTPIASGPQPTEPFEYRGFYRVGKRTVFKYRIGKTEYFDSPWVEDGKFVRTLAPVDEHPLRELVAAHLHFSERQPRELQTPIALGTAAPYAVDTIELPDKNPWNALCFAGGHAFLPDGSALVCTMQGDVWRVRGFDYPSTTATWTRFASGLHHPQGMVVDDEGIFVLGRDQITRLHDLNHTGEADFYECFSNAYETSPAGHDFVCGLVRDQAGQFYTASGNQGIVRISADGKQAEVVATGLRNPDGLGLTADGLVTAPCSEGSWTPASMICAFRPDNQRTGSKAPFFGYGGPRNNEVPSLPLAYLPRGLDNSAGGQTTVTSDRWGPLEGQLLHFSFGAGSHFLVLRDAAHRPGEDPIQGAVVPLPGEFASGAHRGKFSPHDGQLYVSGMHGWGSYTAQTGCFQRVRYTGTPVQLPIGFRLYANGVWLKFSQPVDPAVAASAANHFAQCWNYRYSVAYGSPEYSANHFGVPGHDTIAIRSAQVVDQGTSLFLEIPDLQPVNQLHLRVHVAKETFRELFVTVHQLPATSFPVGSAVASSPKQFDPHPILRDLAMATRSVENPFHEPIEGARAVEIETGTNLSYATRSFRVTAGEPIALTLSNPDVVPHNLAIVKPGTLRRVGSLANQLISDPEAVIRHYIPQTNDVLAYTDVVGSKDQFTIYFKAPPAPGRYPYLCTFPGHWLIMNGEMIVHD